MKRETPAILCGIIAVLATTAQTHAIGDPYEVTEWLEVGTAVLGAGDSIAADIVVVADPSRVVGFEIRFEYEEMIPDASWASDVRVIVTAPQGEQYSVGGLTNLPQSDRAWSFDGPVSDDDGHYGDSGEDIFLPWADAPLGDGTYNVLFSNDWGGDPNPNLYGDIRIRFYTEIPGPGGLGVIVIAGLVRHRRRRVS